ncbi:MAG TPA: hypothetical protein VG890_10075 [Puia sp.]|nr:hypothetical protein [Puia sp.]
MHYRFPLFGCLFLFLLGCSKDKYNVNPSIRIKSYTEIVPQGGTFNTVLEYTQKKGKIEGDTLYVYRNRYNQKPLPDGVPTVDSFYTILSGSGDAIPDVNKAEFSLSLDYNSIHIDNGENDTIDFQFALVDLSGRSSDTVRTGKIVVLQ